MGTPDLDVAELLALARAGRLSTLFGAARNEPVVVVHLTAHDDFDPAVELATSDLGTLPAVFVGVGPRDHAAGALVDVITSTDSEAQAVAAAVADRPLASTALALILRHGSCRSITAGLVAESTTYSMLQAGPEFAAWRARRPGRRIRAPSPDPEVLVHHDDIMTRITLHRPERHNAVDAALSEQLVEALTCALNEADRGVLITGDGPSFCSGGDLDEFGSFGDPASAHTVRLARSAGHLISMMADRVEVHLHGACIGAGIELPAFAGTIVAAADTCISLPELSLGLVPGAGGTVSLPRRIGRHRTALLALTGLEIDAKTAVEWGLADSLVDRCQTRSK